MGSRDGSRMIRRRGDVCDAHQHIITSRTENQRFSRVCMTVAFHGRL